MVEMVGVRGMALSEAAKTQGPVVRGLVKTGPKPQRPQLQLVRKVEVDRTRDALLTDFGKTTLRTAICWPASPTRTCSPA